MAVFDRSTINVGFRLSIALVIILSCFFVLMLRLWYLQIARGDYFRDRSENNRLRTIFIPPPRGFIFDRNREVLVRNRPSFNVDFVIEDSRKPKESLQALAQFTGQDLELLLERLRDQKKRRKFEPKILIKDVSRDLVARLSAKRFEMPGVVVSVVPSREYVYANLAAHVLGYTREISSDQMKSPQFAGYRAGDMVGQYGLESRWEHYLRGERGVQTVIVNASGTKIEEAFFEPEIAGNSLVLTIDRKLQQVADEALLGKRGALVAIDPRNGDVLALASAPAFDPNVFTTDLDRKQWLDLIDSEDNKLTNRVVQGSYPPASVFKIFVAIAALNESVIDPNDKINCPGFVTLGNRKFRCHKHSGHGATDLFGAIVQSCDVYFYTVGQRLGIDRIHDIAKLFGFGEPTELGLVEEASGLVPSTAWKKKAYRDPDNQRWYPGETLPVAIGQGALTATPLQVARGIAAVINGGLVLKPRLVRAVIAADGRMLEQSKEPDVTRTLKIDHKILERVRASMLGVVEDRRGTGHRAALPKESGISVAGKTGTAQVISLKEGAGKGPEDHAWFAGYAPADNPEIVVVAIVENGGHGGAVAAPLVEKVLHSHFNVVDSGSQLTNLALSVED